MRLLQSLVLRFGIMGELLGFFLRNKWWWITPMILVLLVFGVLVTAAQIPVLQPFIYTLF